MSLFVFIPFGAWTPNGSAFGEGLERADNAIPIHGGLRPVQKAIPVTSMEDGPATGAFVHVFAATREQQISRAVSTIAIDGFNWGHPDADDIHLTLDEATPDDVDYMYGRTGAVVLGLDPLEDPGVTTGHTYRYRYQVEGTGGGAWEFSFNLGNALTQSNGTSYNVNTVSGTGDTNGVIQDEVTLTGGEAGAIADYADLSFYFEPLVNSIVAQKARPSTDETHVGWVNQAGGTTNLFQSIDETSGSETDYITSPTTAIGGAETVYRTLLAGAVDPVYPLNVSTDWVVRYRYQAANAGMKLVVRLLSGLVLVREVTHSPAATSVTAGTFTLTEAEIGLIDWNLPLYLEYRYSFPAVVTPTVFQTGVPVEDLIGEGAWQASSGNDLYAMIDADDTDVITASGVGPAVFQVALGDLLDPGVDTNHTIYVKGRKLLAGLCELEFKLYDGDREIHSHEMTFTSTTVSVGEIPLPASVVAQIIDYTDLSLKVTYSGGGGAEIWYLHLDPPYPRRGAISWAEFEVPTAAKVKLTWAELRIPAAASTYQGDKATFYVGTPTALYEATEAGFVDVSKAAYGADPSGSWRFAAWGEDVVATNYTDPVQVRVGGAGNFEDCFTSTDKPKARCVAVFRDQLAIADINLTGHAADEVWLSAINDREDMDPSVITGCDYQRILSRPGQVMQLVGGENLIVLKRSSTHVLYFTGGSLIFRVDEVSKDVGTPSPLSVVGTDKGYFFWGGGGFYLGDTSGATRIGDDAVTRYLTDVQFSADAMIQQEPKDIAIEDQAIIGAQCPFSRRILWTYQSRDDAAYRHSRTIALDPETGLWAPIPGPVDVAYLATVTNLFTSDTHLLKGLYGLSWDGTDTTWFKLADGRTYAMVFETKIRDLGQEGMATIEGIKPVFSYVGDQPPVTIVVTGYRDAAGVGFVKSETVTPGGAVNSEGEYQYKVPGFFFRFRIEVDELVARTLNKFDGLYVRFRLEEGGRA